jgi:NTP pyrophosphatase (non-canonical NTP hydrolase)
MFDAKKMNEWRDKAHGLAIEKGWYEEKRSRLSLVMLINSEVFEAYECWRKKEDLTYFDNNGKPCGLPSELADIVIRLFDMAGYYEVNFFKIKELDYNFNYDWFYNFEKFCSIISKDMFNWEFGDFLNEIEYFEMIKYIYDYCDQNNIDLKKEMNQKHEYNKIRTNRHGGKRS